MHDYCLVCRKPSWKHEKLSKFNHPFKSAFSFKEDFYAQIQEKN